MTLNIFAARMVKRAGIVLLGLAVLGLAGCFYMPASAGHGTARASIGLGKSLPANLTGTFTLIVGGPGMSTITQQYQLGTMTSGPLDIPSGVARTFTLIANTPSVTLIGQATVDLAPGETRDVLLTPVAGGSQIIAPDNLNNRLVQVADMKGTGWTELPVSSPDDIDFDDQGRIYFSSNSTVLRIDDITDTKPVPITSTPQGGLITSIAMDRPRGLLYYTDGSALFRIQATPTIGTAEPVLVGSIPIDTELNVVMSNVKGIAVDSEGFVYITMPFGRPAGTVIKINPNPADSPTMVAIYKGTFTNPWDVLVKGDDVYVSDYGDPYQQMIPGRIVRLTKDLQMVDSFAGPASDPFYGPERFIAILNRPIVVVDEYGNYPTNLDRIVSFDDMTGTGWTVFGSSGSSIDQFQFFIAALG